MDITVSSNFERLLFDLLNRDAMRLGELMQQFRDGGRFEMGPDVMGSMRVRFGAQRCDDEQTLQTIGAVYKETGKLIDPHTAVGLHAARTGVRPGNPLPTIALGCAHAAKFPDAVEKATGIRPELPPRLADLLDRPEKYDVLANDLGAITEYVRQRGRRSKAA